MNSSKIQKFEEKKTCKWKAESKNGQSKAKKLSKNELIIPQKICIKNLIISLQRYIAVWLRANHIFLPPAIFFFRSFHRW